MKICRACISKVYDEYTYLQRKILDKRETCDICHTVMMPIKGIFDWYFLGKKKGV